MSPFSFRGFEIVIYWFNPYILIIQIRTKLWKILNILITTTTTTNSRRNHSFLHAELLTSPSRGTRLSLQTLRQRADYFREVPEMTSPARSTPPACERTNELASERERKDGSRQSNKEEKQWRHWLASSQVRIASSASLGLRSSVRFNYVLLTVSYQHARP